MKKVIALRKFRDLKENTIRHKGDVFECSDERFEQITGIATKYPFIEEYKEPEETEEATEEATEEPKETEEATEEEAAATEEPKEEAKEPKETEEKPKRTRRKTATK